MVNLGFSLVKSNVTTSLLARTVATREYRYCTLLTRAVPRLCTIVRCTVIIVVSNGNNEQYRLRTCTSCHTNSLVLYQGRERIL